MDRAEVIARAIELGAKPADAPGPGRYEHTADPELALALETLSGEGWQDEYGWDSNDCLWDRLDRWLITASEQGFLIVEEFANAEEASDKLEDLAPEPEYEVWRHFADGGPSVLIKTGLSLEEAQAHCRDPETSSRTATGARERALTAERGAWFDGYEEVG